MVDQLAARSSVSLCARVFLDVPVHLTVRKENTMTALRVTLPAEDADKIIDTIWLIQTTSTADRANTDARDVKLLVGDNEFVFPDIVEHDERERGGSDQYEFPISKYNMKARDLNAGNIHVSFAGIPGGDDRWLPESFWVIGKFVGEDRAVVLVAHPHWPNTAWFQDKDGAKKRNLFGDAT
jgi:hypothetical protein